MDSKLSERLKALPPLSIANKQVSPCKICSGQAAFFDVVDFNKCCSLKDYYEFGRSGIPVMYFRCGKCGFVFTRFFDSWTKDEFAQFVYNDDYIRVDGEYAGVRPEREAAALAHRLGGLTDLRVLDYGSGAGVFAEHLRGHGLARVTNYDPFSMPVRPEGTFDLITCYEVLEHTTTPRTILADIVTLLAPGGCVIFSTGIQPALINELRANWWYVAPRNGHASIYTLKALALAGAPLGLTLHAGQGATAFCHHNPSAATRQIIESVGPAQRFFNLTAPARDQPLSKDQAALWHNVEGIGPAAFRWTKKADIAWRLHTEPMQPGDYTVTVPTANEVEQGFINRCHLVVDGKQIALERDGPTLTGYFTLAAPAEAIIRLMTPKVQRPCDLRAVADDRSLGIGIAIGSSNSYFV
jgi:SAM-dependent methyltransferase